GVMHRLGTARRRESRPQEREPRIAGVDLLRSEQELARLVVLARLDPGAGEVQHLLDAPMRLDRGLRCTPGESEDQRGRERPADRRDADTTIPTERSDDTIRDVRTTTDDGATGHARPPADRVLKRRAPKEDAEKGAAMGGENENDLGFGEEEWRRTYDALLQFLKGLKRRKAADLDLSTADLLHDVLQRCFAQPNGAATVRERGFVARVFSQVVGDEVDRRRAWKRGGDRQRITLSDHPLQGDG